MKSEFIDNPGDRRNTASMTTETDNRSIVEQALAQLIATGDVEALEPLLSDDFVHHRSDGTSSTKAVWLAAVRAVPLADLRVEVHHVLADGDHVMMHSRRWIPGAGPGIAGVDIWRLVDGLIVEGWEIIEPVADAAAHVVWWEEAALNGN
ncbi:nuclear transport factor 2 family protein [Streptomyces sp. NPDC046712]|uniref:nuclear transport factor 2 family protein n=1 Tax=Streptomyces sp. NPDC046712 TaxID=3154802 RepID=UPI0034110A46